MSDHYAHGRYGFEWGPFVVERLAHIEGRGWVLMVRTTSGKEMEIHASEKGRELRAMPVRTVVRGPGSTP